MTDTTRDETQAAVDTDATIRRGNRYARNAGDTEGTTDPNDTDTARRADVTTQTTTDDTDTTDAEVEAEIAAELAAETETTDTDGKDDEDAEATE